MRILLLLTLGVSFLYVVWQNSVTTTTQKLRLHTGARGKRKFSISSDSFYINGTPTRLISCELHYFRIPHSYWRDRLQRSKTLGCNSIQTYIPWNFHEPAPGVFDFLDQHDAEEFIRLAQDEGLYVLLRPGPFICAEWDFGGLPAWLLDSSMTGKDLVGRMRTNDPVFMKFVRSWWQELLPRMKPLMFGQGGPILMMQIENEYGFKTFLREELYLQELRDIAKQHLGDDATLYTTDAPGFLMWGGLPDMYHAVDFGPNKPTFISFLSQKLANASGKKAAPFNSEFYTGWLTRWGNTMANTSCAHVMRSLTNILRYGGGTGSVNFYMAHGGTNFGFWAGCNGDEFDITSYDYNCPISESGQTGQPGVGGANKFKAVRETIMAVTGQRIPEPLPEPELVAHGEVVLKDAARLMDNLDQLHIADTPIFSQQPLPMESYGLAYGMLSYTTSVHCGSLKGGTLSVRAYDLMQVIVDGRVAGQLWRAKPSSIVLPSTVCSSPAANASVSLLVNTYGRDNFYVTGTTEEMLKGIVGPVFLRGADGRHMQLTNWNVHAMPLVQPGKVLRWSRKPPEATTMELVQSTSRKAFDSLHGSVWRNARPTVAISRKLHQNQSAHLSTAGMATIAPNSVQEISENLLSSGLLKYGPTFYRGEISVSGNLKDSYLSTRAWGRGYVWVNGNNIGRFWTRQGPQQALYVPAVFLQEGINEIIVLELESKRPEVTKFLSAPDFSGAVIY